MRLSRKNYAIDAGLYPLGSCTMKHNPRLNEKMARLPGFGDVHPLQPHSTVQGALALIGELVHWLTTLTGMPAVAMSPKAGAHGELCGLLAIRAAIEARGEGATARSCWCPNRPTAPTPPPPRSPASRWTKCRPSADGHVDADALKAKLGPDVAAIMLTNPNTCGLFEGEIIEIAEAVHEAGAYFYCDGANFNAIAGRVRPGRSGHRRHAHQSAQDLLDAAWRRRAGRGSGGAVGAAGALRAAAAAGADGETASAGRTCAMAGGHQPFGRMCAFHGQMGMFVRALSLHAVATARRRAPGLRRRGASANYILRLAERRDERAVRRGPLHARGPVRRPLPGRHAASPRSISPRR